MNKTLIDVNYRGRKLRYNCFDIEVYPNYWEVRSEEWTISSRDEKKNYYNIKSQLLREVIVGYNIKKYDNIILYNILYVNDDVDYIYDLNNKVIGYNEGIYDISYWNKFNFIDLIDFVKNANDDKRIGLKTIAGNMGLSILESSISFENGDLITDDNFHEHDEYLENDVVITRALFEKFGKLVATKDTLAEIFNVDLMRAYKSTFTKLATNVVYKPCDVEFDLNKCYEIPEPLVEFITNNVRKDILDYYLKTPYKNIKKFEFESFGNKGNFGNGGIHTENVDKKFKFNYSDDKRTIFHVDFASYYPFLMLIYNLASRKLDLSKLQELVDERFKIKGQLKGTNDWDLKRIYDTYKELINALFGASGFKSSLIYDPEKISDVTITGQLILAAASEILYKNGIDIIQTNTDGIVCIVDNDKADLLRVLAKEVEDIVGIEFEVDKIDKFIQWNVNTYIEIEDCEEAKHDYEGVVAKGGAVGNFRGDNLFSCQYPIVQRAIVDHFVLGKPVSQTIYDCDDIRMFSNNLKVGWTYDSCNLCSYTPEYDKVDSLGYKHKVKKCHDITNEHTLQKTNRIINTIPSGRNKIVFKKKLDSGFDKVANQSYNIDIINDDCSVYNINDFNINYDYYVHMACKKIKEIG